MQAVLYSVILRKRLVVVLSARQVWFVRLLVTDGRCSVAISPGTMVGRRGFFREVVQFLTMAQESDLLDDQELRHWQAALGQGRTEEQGGGDDAVTDDDTPGGGDPASGGGRSHLGRAQGTDSSALASSSTRNTCDNRRKGTGRQTTRGNQASGSITGQSKKAKVRHQINSQYSQQREAPCDCGNFERSEQGPRQLDDSPVSVDANGVVVPWLDQISVAEATLGKGRSGTVTKSRWGNQFIAVKTFSLHDADDTRDPIAIYSHEIDVLNSLEELWGTYVPRLFFRLPWPTSPMIGMQLGEPMPDDFDKWTAEDLVRRDAAVAAVKALGWVQTDFRGANFVRLAADGNGTGFIAMIDFEYFEAVA